MYSIKEGKGTNGRAKGRNVPEKAEEDETGDGALNSGDIIPFLLGLLRQMIRDPDEVERHVAQVVHNCI